MQHRAVLGPLFWGQDLSSSHAPEGLSRTLGGGPPPLQLSTPSGLNRALQLYLLHRFLDVPAVPSFVGSQGGVVLDRVLASVGGKNWWGSTTLRVRAQSIWSQRGNEEARPLFKPGMYGGSARARWNMGRDTLVVASSEIATLNPILSPALLKTRSRSNISIAKKIPRHEIRAEAAINQRCVDASGGHWDVPHTMSVDVSSKSRSSFSYRVGVHKTSLPVQATEEGPDNSGARESTLVAQAAAQFARTIHLWRRKPAAANKKQEQAALGEESVCAPEEVAAGSGARRRPSRKPHGAVLQTPRLSLDFAFGGLARSAISQPGGSPLEKRPFGLAGITMQLGSFTRPVLDFTRLNICMHTGGEGCILNPGAPNHCDKSSSRCHSVPASMIPGGVVVVPTTISASLTQQIFGPIRAKVDARLMPMGSNGTAYGDGSSLPTLRSTGLGLLETSYGLDCALPPGGASRLVVWYSPQRREGMAEVRFLET